MAQRASTKPARAKHACPLSERDAAIGCTLVGQSGWRSLLGRGGERTRYDLFDAAPTIDHSREAIGSIGKAAGGRSIADGAEGGATLVRTTCESRLGFRFAARAHAAHARAHAALLESCPLARGHVEERTP